jgi:UDP-N-acetylglucosamine--N-acetylmuramyl-(pentapeptide) pyrophosphoryl-undecaprenol N-acetylglucosamine transferase
MEKKKIRVIISGGGTGGHIFPAISIANALRSIDPEIEILFVGAIGKMEMEKVPAAGYQIVGLPVVGFHRKLTLKNLSFPFKLIKSLRLASKIVKDFNPDIVVGVGGYASGPILKVAQRMNIPTLIQEQNSYAGVTNKLLAKRAKAICVAYDGMERYFPKQSIILTGNPVRQGLSDIDSKTDEAKAFFGIPESHKVILVVGGSLGARTINNSILDGVEKIAAIPNTTLLWQTGKVNYNHIMDNMVSKSLGNIKVFDFIHRMDLAYSIANLVVSRAGAGTISELCLVGNVAEDHQTKNAKALVNKNAALMITDANAPKELVETLINMVDQEQTLNTLSVNIKSLALPNAANDIAAKALELITKQT